MFARKYGHWNKWCEALTRNNNNVEDVVQAEENEWLLGSDWREEWRRRLGSDHWDLLYSTTEEESEEEDDEMLLSVRDDVNEEIELADEDIACHEGDCENNT
jgi:hypothetical protein